MSVCNLQQNGNQIVGALPPRFGFKRVCWYSTPRWLLDPDSPKEFLPPQNHSYLISFLRVCILHICVYTVNSGARGGRLGGLPQISICSMTLGRTLQHTVLELGVLPGPSIHSPVQRLSGVHPLLTLSFHLCRARLQEGRLGEPSEPRVAHSSGVWWIRLPGFRICLLLSPVHASVSSPVQ